MPSQVFGEFLLNYGTRIATPFYETMLKHISKGDYVYSSFTDCGGFVKDIVRDIYNYPICIKVQCDKETIASHSHETNYISIERIVYWNKWKKHKRKFTKDELWTDKYFKDIEYSCEAYLETNGGEPQ